MTAPLDVMVLCAGKSERIRSVSGDIPKPLIPIAGRSIVEWNLRWLAGQGIRVAWVNLHFHGDYIRQTLGTSCGGIALRYSEEPEILGTAGAVGNIRAQLGDTGILVVYGDNLISFDLSKMLAAHHASGADATIALFDQGRHSNTGIAGGRVMLDSSQRIIDFREGGDAPPLSPFVNAGVYLLQPAIVALIPPGQFFDFGKDLFPALLAEGKTLRGYVLEDADYCLGLDTPASFERGIELIREGAVKLS